MKALRLIALLLPVCALQAQTVFINELHYDNSGVDSAEGVEIAGPAGTDLSDYEVIFYNGSGGARYDSLTLSGVIDNEGSGTGAVWFARAGIQNGAPDGLVLYQRSTATVVQRLSYEGIFTAADNVAAGLVLPDMGVSENGSNAAGTSLQLTGSGAALPDFTWTGPVTATPGTLNAGQTFSLNGPRTATMVFSPSLLREAQSTTLTLSVSPPPPVPYTYNMSASRGGSLALPAQITVPVTGSVSLPVTAVADGVADGFEELVISAAPLDAAWPAAAAGVQVVDADRPFVNAPGAFRVMSFNVRLGLGTPGSTEFNAVREIVERLSPDVLCLQEVSSAGNFGDFLTLATQAGFPADAAHTAISGDAFAAQPYVRGDIPGGSDVNVVILSRWPVTQRLQLGRGASGRAEITRYPLLAKIDVPWLSAAEDPAIVTLHLKADTEDASAFRRAVEALRTREYLTAAGYSGSTGNLIITGDFNANDRVPQPASYQTNSAPVQQPGTGTFADGTKLPVSFVPGSDLLAGFTLPYAIFPHSGFNPLGCTAVPLLQPDGSEATFYEAKLDYLFVNQPIAARGGLRTEVYNSRLEHSHDGLPKRRTLPDGALSATASDHFAFFADIPLVTRPSLSVTFSRDWLMEGDSGLTATVTLSPPPVEPVTVALETWRDARLSLPSTITLTAAQPSVTLPVEAHWLPRVEAHRAVTLTASAAGCMDGQDSVQIRNREAGSVLVISQYHEPASGSAGRAVELLNVSGAPIDFSRTTLHLRRYSNGADDGVMDAEAASGILPAGAVLVVGDETAGDYLVAQGLLPAPAQPFTSQLDHTVNLNAAGHAAFVKDQLVFTGDDALEVILHDTRSDVFGEIGHDPGTAWTGPGSASTADGTLTLRPELSTGSSGWRQPGLRFSFAPASLAGFGIAPAVTDPYRTWTATAGLTGLQAALHSDPDADGLDNLTEYAVFTPLTPQPAGFIRRLRANDPTLTFTVESSPHLLTWQAAAGSESTGPVLPDGSRQSTFTLSTVPGRLFLRQRIARP